MLDSVIYKCECGKEVEWQSKADDCVLANYSNMDVPVTIANDINGEIQKCKCGRYYKISGCALPQRIGMKVTLVDDPNKHLC